MSKRGTITLMFDINNEAALWRSAIENRKSEGLDTVGMDLTDAFEEVVCQVLLSYAECKAAGLWLSEAEIDPVYGDEEDAEENV